MLASAGLEANRVRGTQDPFLCAVLSQLIVVGLQIILHQDPVFYLPKPLGMLLWERGRQILEDV